MSGDECGGHLASSPLPPPLGKGTPGLVLGFGVILYFFLLRAAHLRTPHHEVSWRYPDEFHADAVCEILGRGFLFLGLDGGMAC